MRAEFIANEPALMLRGRRRLLIVADLHLGLIGFYDKTIVDRLNNLIEHSKADEVIVLGDLKHGIKLSQRVEKLVKSINAELTLVKGNHDGYLKGEKFLEIGKFCLFHGHAKPENLTEFKYLIFAHAHPAVYLQGIKERVWLVGEWSGLKVMVMPAFNDLCAMTAVNVQQPAGFMFKIWDYANAEIFTLDCLFLGKVKDFKEKRFSTSL
jgi:putative SbcD/Mre11-related phosphoesterase